MEEQKLEIVVSPQQKPERIDKLLAREITQVSRTRLQQLLHEQLILVNGKQVKSSYNVHPGEKIEVIIPKPQKTQVLPEDIPLDILYEDAYLIIVNKPAGMVVHPALGNKEGTLVNALLHYCKDLSGINGRLRPGIVHRLDKDTSGLLVVAKDDKTHRNLSQQFSERTISRKYVSLIWGHPDKTEGRIETYYGRSPTNRKKMAALPEGKLAITNYNVLQYLPLLTLVALKLETGRTHQIRVHMAHIGHPVFCDYVYGGKNRRLGSLNKKDREIALRYFERLNRQALHAQTLGFVHPVTKEKMNFESPIPDDMQHLIHFANQINQQD